MKSYKVSKWLESVVSYMNEKERVQKMELVNHLISQDAFDGRFDLCSKFVEWLKIQGYLRVKNAFYGYLVITEKAEKSLAEKREIWLKREFLEGIQENYQLLMGLKLVRKMISEEKGMDLFKVCPNYMLEKLAKYMPEDLDSLLKISGFKEWKGDTQWHRYLEVIQEWKQKQSNYSLSA